MEYDHSGHFLAACGGVEGGVWGGSGGGGGGGDGGEGGGRLWEALGFSVVAYYGHKFEKLVSL